MVYKNVLRYVLSKLKYHSEKNNSENNITCHFLTNNTKNGMNQIISKNNSKNDMK